MSHSKEIIQGVRKGMSLSWKTQWQPEAERTEGHCIITLWTLSRDVLRQLNEGVGLIKESTTAAFTAAIGASVENPIAGSAIGGSALSARYSVSQAKFAEWALVFQWNEKKNDTDNEKIFPRIANYQIFKDEESLIPTWSSKAPTGNGWTQKCMAEIVISPKKINYAAKKICEKKERHREFSEDYKTWIIDLGKELDDPSTILFASKLGGSSSN